MPGERIIMASPPTPFPLGSPQLIVEDVPQQRVAIRPFSESQLDEAARAGLWELVERDILEKVSPRVFYFTPRGFL